MNINIQSNVPDLKDNIIIDNDNQDINKEGDLNHKDINDRANDILKIENCLLEDEVRKIDAAKEILSQPDPTKDVDSKKKTKTQLIEDIKTLEHSLGLPPKSISKWTKKPLERYLVELINKAGLELQESQVLGSKSETTIEEINTAKDRLVKETKIEMENIKKDSLDKNQGAEFLYRMHFTTMYLLERISVMTENKTNVNLTGICDRLEEDKTKILMPLYIQIYKENEEIIKTYGNPGMQLLFYTLTVMGASAAMNIKKKQMNK